jgi:hypothetical protein
MPKSKHKFFREILELDKKNADETAKTIPIESTHLVIAQNLLPFLYKNNILGGKTFDVLMTRRPIEILQNHLNKAFDNYPKNITLKDFRADKILMRIENKVLTKTRKIITPHSDIVTIFQNKTIQLP